MENAIFFVCLLLGFASALVAGVFQSFSDFVMAGLGRARPAGGIESMQHINRTVFRSVFLTSFLLLVPATMLFGGYTLFTTDSPDRGYIAAATGIYLVTVFGVTMFGNVPMTKHLDQLDFDSEEAANYWRVYCRDWTRWNHVRTFGAAATAAVFLLAAASIHGIG